MIVKIWHGISEVGVHGGLLQFQLDQSQEDICDCQTAPYKVSLRLETVVKEFEIVFQQVIDESVLSLVCLNMSESLIIDNSC